MQIIINIDFIIIIITIIINAYTRYKVQIKRKARRYRSHEYCESFFKTNFNQSFKQTLDQAKIVVCRLYIQMRQRIVCLII